MAFASGALLPRTMTQTYAPPARMFRLPCRGSAWRPGLFRHAGKPSELANDGAYRRASILYSRRQREVVDAPAVVVWRKAQVRRNPEKSILARAVAPSRGLARPPHPPHRVALMWRAKTDSVEKPCM